MLDHVQRYISHDEGSVFFDRVLQGMDDPLTSVLVLLVVLALAALIGWLAYGLLSRRREVVNLVDDINIDVVAPLAQHDAVLAALGSRLDTTRLDMTSNAADLRKYVKGGDAALAKVFGASGSSNASFFNSATTWDPPGVDLQLLRHTNAMMGLTVGGPLDVSGGFFRVDPNTGNIRLCPPSATSNACSEFNDPSGNIHLRAPTLAIDAISVFGGGSKLVGMPAGATVDVSGALVANQFAGGRFATYGGGSQAALATDPTTGATTLTASKSLALGGPGPVSCRIDAGGVTVANGGTPVVQIDASNNVVVSATNISLIAGQSGQIKMNKAPVLVDASGNPITIPAAGPVAAHPATAVFK